MRTVFTLISCLLLHFSLYAQPLGDSASKEYKIAPKSIIIPSVLTAYGFVGLNNYALKSFDLKVKSKLENNTKTHIDDYLIHLSYSSVYVFNMLGLKGKHNFRDRTIILGTAYFLMGTSVTGLKYTTKIERPDGSARNAFPSGHTATAFMGAEFIYQEYKHRSVWIGVGGYAVATAVGYFRMHNNRHWFTDVMSGAGIGILTTKLAYWLYPKINNLLPNCRKNNNDRVHFQPFYNGGQSGLALVFNL